MEFYRVYHDESISPYDEVDGFLAGDPYRQLNLNPNTERGGSELGNIFQQHLDWNNTESTPFVSMYKSPHTALITAKAWERRGKENVRVASIDRDTLANHGYIWYRDVRKLARKLNLWIREEIWQSTVFEMIVYHQIPAEAVSEIYTVDGFEEYLRSLFSRVPKITTLITDHQQGINATLSKKPR